jgi:hypothetical protein
MLNFKPKLENLPLSAYVFLQKMGMLYEFYPEATDNWRNDCPKPKPLPITLEKFTNGA